MEIDTGQTWRHKHNRQLVEVIDASKGTVVFRKRDSRIEWTARQFLVWYQQVPPQPKPGSSRARLEDSFSQEQRQLQAGVPIRDGNPKVGELWFSMNREESCVIEEIKNGDTIGFRYATEHSQRHMQAWWFRQSHAIASPVAKPEYDPADVAFTERFKQLHDKASASQAICRAKQTAKHARAVIEASKAATGAVIAAPEAIEELKAQAIEALDQCHQVSQELRDALDRLETT